MTYRPFSIIIQQAVSASSDAATGVKFEMQNDSGSTIVPLQPVCSDVDGNAKSVDPSVEYDATRVVGVAGQEILDGTYGYVYSHGKFENITTSYDFGDYVYISKSGGLTNILPSYGVDGFDVGDWIVRIGVIVRNRATPSQKDLVINLKIVGQI